MWHRREELKRAEESMAEEKAKTAFLARGDAAVFAHYHDWEAQVARGFKIEEAWEPSPFPAELPAAQRPKVADPIFAPTPWIDFPDTWRRSPPQMPGEMLFGLDDWDRERGAELLRPITRDQAEARHNTFKGYTLMTRLAEGQLLILTYRGSLEEGRLGPPVRYYLHIHDSSPRFMIADFREKSDQLGLLEMRTIDIKGPQGHKGPTTWYSSLSFDKGEKSIYDYRGAKKPYECRPMTAADRSAYAFPVPRFADFDNLWQRISMYLDKEGFGAFK